MPSKPWTSRKAPTHFLCLPLCNVSSRAQLIASLQSFQEQANDDWKDKAQPDVTGTPPAPEETSATYLECPQQPMRSEPESSPCPQPTVSVNMFRPPGTLHFTLGVMHLADAGQLELAKKLLEALDLNRTFSSIDNQTPDVGNDRFAPLHTNLESVYALPSPWNTRVLYTAPPPNMPSTTRLQAVADTIRHSFLAAGLLEDEGRPLLLHATLFNTIYGKVKGKRRRKSERKLNTARLIEAMKGFGFARNINITRVALCEMGAKHVEGEEGQRYWEVAGKGFPTWENGEDGDQNR